LIVFWSWLISRYKISFKYFISKSCCVKNKYFNNFEHKFLVVYWV
jgi:hypothetical protein